MKKSVSFQQVVLEQLDTHMQEIIIIIIKIYSKWIIGLNVKCKIIKLLKGNIGVHLDYLEFASDFLDTKPTVQSIERNN